MPASYLIQNNHHIPLHLHGHTLASSRSAVDGVAGRIWLTETEMEDSHAKALLARGMITVLETRGLHKPPAPKPKAVVAPKPKAIAAPTPEVTEEPSVESVEDSVEGPSTSSENGVLKEDLLSMRLTELKQLASDRGVDIEGLRRKAQIISAILGG